LKLLFKLERNPFIFMKYLPQLLPCGMFFDGASSREGVGSGVVFVLPCQETISLSYKLEFETTNNVEEYEDIFMGLRAAKDMEIEEIAVFGDVELIVQQIINVYLSSKVIEMKFGI
jgi:ribonuclease HI